MSQDLINALKANRVNAVALGDDDGVAVIDGRIAELEAQVDKSLSQMTKAELVELAAATGVEVDESSKKADIVAALEAGGVEEV